MKKSNTKLTYALIVLGVLFIIAMLYRGYNSGYSDGLQHRKEREKASQTAAESNAQNRNQ